MAEKKKRKSIYDKPLRDINKDGKVNFGDTWLGDALGFDGKMGIQKGRPGLRDSLKGARRGKAESKEDKPAKRSSSSRSRPASSNSKKKVDVEKMARDTFDRLDREDGGGTRPRSRPGTVRPKQSPRRPAQGVPKPDKIEVTPLDSKTETKPTPQGKKITYAEWENLSVAERKKRGLPKNKFEWQNQGKLGIPEVKPGMAKGGMAMKKEGRYQQNGGRDMKKTGMFYKSGSPRGYK